MILPASVFVLSLIGTLASALIPGQSDWLLLATPCAIASLILVLRAWRPKPRSGPDWVIVDGSNVMHWHEGRPDLRPVRDVIRALTEAGLTPGVVFDANAGYKLEGRYLHDGPLSRRLKLPRDRVMVVPKNAPADPMILTAARDFGARVVTRDLFRDWTEDFPEIRQPGFLIKGRYEGDRLTLDLPHCPPPSSW